MDWTGLSVLAVLLVACVGYLSRQIARVETRLDTKIDGLEGRLAARLDRLEERYVRHLELHAGPG